MIKRPGVAILSDQVLSSQDVSDTKSAVARPGDIVMRVLHTVAIGDFDGVGALLTDDVEFTIPTTHVPLPVRRALGREAVIAALRANFAVIQPGQAPELVTLVADAEQCVMIVKERGATTDGQVYEGYGVFAFTVLDGRVARLIEITAAAQPY